jgi:peroxiredoxin (alkyl hydroperoxide reductase subunit C)
MKHYQLLLFLVLSFAINCPAAQLCNSLVGQKAFNFKAQAVIEGEIKDVSLSDYKDKYKILIFYPADFSFICPTELFAFEKKKKIFEDKKAALLAISVDQVYAHQAWLEKPRDEGGIEGISYPLVSDITKNISCKYGVLNQAKGIALRGIIIIDPQDIIQHISINNESVGRNIDEVVRVLEAIQFTQEHSNVCPANWEKNKESMDPTEKGLKEYLEKTKKEKS